MFAELGTNMLSSLFPDENTQNLIDIGIEMSTSMEKLTFETVLSYKIWAVTQERFSQELEITILPLDKLEGKIFYNDEGFPRERKLKRVMKTASGEEFYLSFDISLYKGGVGVGIGGITPGGKIKPEIAFNFILSNAKGKVIDEIKIKKIKTDIVVAKERTSVGGIKTGTAEDPEVIIEKTMEVYNNALTVFIEKFKKEHKKEYKNMM